VTWGMGDSFRRQARTKEKGHAVGLHDVPPCVDYGNGSPRSLSVDRRRSDIAAPHALLPPPRPGQFEPIAARSAGSATYCSMYPHDMQMCRSGTMFFQNETANLFMGPRAPPLGGPTRTSVDWHFWHFPDFMSHLLGLRFRSVCPTVVISRFFGHRAKA